MVQASSLKKGFDVRKSWARWDMYAWEKIGRSEHKFEWMVGSVYMNCEGVRKEENILKLEYIKGVVWRALEDGLGIIIGGDMNAHIWELDGCENENGRRMKENKNEMGLQILNYVWDWLNEATWYTEEKKFTLDYVYMDRRGMKKVVHASILDIGEVIESDHAAIRVDIAWKGVMRQRKRLQTTPPTSGGAVTADSSCCAKIVSDPLDGWRCCSQKRVMSRPIPVRQL